MQFVDVIARKRDGEALPREAIDQFVEGVVGGQIPDYQASALLMAIVLRGMTDDETAWLTDAMVRSGDRVDLSDLPAPAGPEPAIVRARVGIGQLVVIVPDGVAVRVEGKAGLGNVKVLEREEGGIDVDLVVEPPAGAEPTLDLRLSVGIGEVSVEHG